MATNPQREGYERSGWPGKGKIMTEDAYHELERLSPDRKYEYLDGIAYMMSGGSVAHDRINRNIGNALDRNMHHFYRHIMLHKSVLGCDCCST